MLINECNWSPHIANITKQTVHMDFFVRTAVAAPPYVSAMPTWHWYARSWNTVQLYSIHSSRVTDSTERIQRQAVRSVTRDCKSNTPGSSSRLLHRSRLPSLRECRQQLRLVLFYRVVEGSMPTLPPEHFLTPQQPGSGRLVRAWKQADVNTTTG